MKAPILQCSLLRCALLFTFYLVPTGSELAAQNGTLLWQFPVGGSMSKCPAIDEEGVVYISAPDQNVHALNGQTGELLWSYPTELGLSTAPVLGPDGTVYVGLSDTNIVALNGKTGELLWEVPTTSKAFILGLSDANTLFAHGGAGFAMALGSVDGSALWETTLPTLIPSSGLAISSEGTLFFSTSGSFPETAVRLWSVDGATGDVLFDYPAGGTLKSSQPILGADGTAYFAGRDGMLYAVSSSGSLRWKASLGGGQENPIVLGEDGSLYVASGKLLAINATTGRARWTFIGNKQIVLSPATAADGTVYAGTWVTSPQGILYAVNAQDGQENWRFSLPTPLTSPPTIGPNGVVYVASQDGNLYAVQGSAPLADSPWPKWQQNLANTGQSRWMEGAAEVLGQSGDELAAEGSPVWLWVNPKGQPPFTYQWYRDGEAIPDATEDHLIFSSVGFTDEGSYHAVVSNALGTATTEPIGLAVGYSVTVDWYPVLGTVTGVPDDEVLLPSTELVLEAEGVDGQEFLRWEGDLEAVENPLAIRVESALHIRARFTAEPGTLLWSFDAGETVRGSPAIDGAGNVYIGVPGEAIALDGSTGVLKWRAAAARPGEWPSPVVGSRGLVYCSDSDVVVALEAGDGYRAWSAGQHYSTGTSARNRSPVSVGKDGTVYFGNDYQSFFALDGRTGENLWEVKTPNASPAAVGPDGTLYVATFEDGVFALDGHDGSTRWNVPMWSWGAISPVLDGLGSLIAVSDTPSAPHVVAFDVSNGEQRWEVGVAENTDAVPSIGLNGMVYVETTGGLTALNGSTGEELWILPEAGTRESSPAVAADGTVFVGSEDGRLYALNGESGEVIWTYQTGAGIRCSPNIGADGTVYIGSDDGKLYAIAGSAPLADTPWPKYQADMQNSGRGNVPPPPEPGDLMWQFPVALGGSLSACPAIGGDGVVYLSSPDQKVRALNGRTGEVLWSYATELGASTAPVLGMDGTVYLGLADTNIVALNGATGEVLWETPSSDKTWVLGLSDNDTLFAHGGAGLAMALNAADGAVLWEVNLGTLLPSWGMALDATGRLFLFTRGKLLSIDGGNGEVLAEYVTDGQPLSSANPALGADGTAYCGSRYNGLHALEAYSGAVRWNAPLVTDRESPLVIGVDGTVYVNTGRLHAINAATGRDQWVFDPEGSLWGSPSLAADGTLYVGADDGIFYALDARNGSEKWRFTRADSRFRASTVGPDGTVYVVSGDGNLYALHGSAPLANSPWPKWQQNLANTGQSHWSEGGVGVLGQSGDELAAEGSNLRFWVNANGAPPFEYRWFRHDELIPDATFNYLVLPDVGSGNAGSYHAIVSNSLGEATTEPMELTIGYSLAVDWYPILGTVQGVPTDAVLLPGTEVVLEAEGTEAHAFLGWEGDIESTQNPLTIQVESNLHIRARFAVEAGTVLWAHDTGERVRGSAAIGTDGTVYIGADYSLIAVEGDSGALKWRTGRAWGQQTPTPVVGPAGLVYGCDPNRVLAFEAGTGQWVWQSGDSYSSSYVPTPASLGPDGTVYHSDDNRKLRALDGLTGETFWEIQTADNASPPAVGVDGRLYVSTYGSRIQSFEQSDGSELWSVESGAQAYHTPALDGLGNLFAAAGPGAPTGVTRVDTTTGERLWSTHLSTYFSSPTLGLNETVLVQTGSGAFCLSQADGEVLWSITEARTEDCSPATASDGTVYVGSNDGLFRAVDGQTGEVIWTFQAGDGIYCSPNIGPDGTVYIGSYDGKLYAIAGSAPLADTPWPKYQADMQNSGRVNVPPVVPVEMQLLGVGLREDGAFVFEVQGPPTTEGVLEESENLRDWSNAATVVLDESGRATVVNNSPASDTARFYRIRVAP